MAGPVFDAAGYVRFDLHAGSVGTRDGDDLVLVPLELLGVPVLGGELASAARSMGEARGVRFAAWAATSSGAEPLGLEALAQNLDGALAVLGFGRTEIDVRGDALLFRVRGRCDVAGSEALGPFLCGFFAGFVSAIDPSMPFDVVYIGTEAGGTDDAVFFAGNPDAVERMNRWLGEGVDPYDAIQRLHTEGGIA
jgi:hypothetical protein